MSQSTMKKDRLTRRNFLRQVAVGSSLVCSLAEGQVLTAQNPRGTRYDLLIKGGRIVDPSQSLSADLDLAISGDRIAQVAARIPETEARQVLNARGKVVTPGLIDVHVHVYDGVGPHGIPADPNCIAKGVTTVLDAGSSGAYNFPGLRKYVINVVDTRVYALLNIALIGIVDSGDSPYTELLDLHYSNPKIAVRTIEQHRDVILGVKVRLRANEVGETSDHDLAALKLALEASDAVKLPLMVHGATPGILPLLRKGDVVTHCFHAGAGGILDEKGRVLRAVREAVGRGVHLDVGHGRGGFNFAVAEQALAQELLPGTISSDVHFFNVTGPVFDLATTLSKFMHMGLTLEQVIERAATNPANTFGFPKGLGTLAEGAVADVAVFWLAEGDFQFMDSQEQSRLGHRKLVPVATVKAGRIYGSSSIPIVLMER